jgi:3-dehydroquinate dehydratase-2
LRTQIDGQSVELTFFQSNAEHELINRLHEARGLVQWAIINPGAFTHTSIALRDAFLATSIAFVEVHLSNVHQREAFRQQSYLSDIAAGVVTGLGARGYGYALDYILAQGA